MRGSRSCDNLPSVHLMWTNLYLNIHCYCYYSRSGSWLTQHTPPRLMLQFMILLAQKTRDSKHLVHTVHIKVTLCTSNMISWILWSYACIYFDSHLNRSCSLCSTSTTSNINAWRCNLTPQTFWKLPDKKLCNFICLRGVQWCKNMLFKQYLQIAQSVNESFYMCIRRLCDNLPSTSHMNSFASNYLFTVRLLAHSAYPPRSWLQFLILLP